MWTFRLGDAAALPAMNWRGSNVGMANSAAVLMDCLMNERRGIFMTIGSKGIFRACKG